MPTYREVMEGEPKQRKQADPREFRLQAALVRHLKTRARPDVFWCAIPNGEYRTNATLGKLKAMGIRAGAPDLLFIVKGRPIGLELKAGDGAASDEQEAVALDWTGAGGLYTVAVGMDQALGFLEMVGAIKPDVSRVAA